MSKCLNAVVGLMSLVEEQGLLFVGPLLQELFLVVGPIVMHGHSGEPAASNHSRSWERSGGGGDHGGAGGRH